MKVIYLGVGEAFDENIPNNSHLVITDRINLLLDCGFSAVPQLWKFNEDSNFLDAIYISHWHADHYFGLPALLVRMLGDGRTKKIAIISQKGFKKQFNELMDLAYAGFLEKFRYEIEIMEVEENESIKVGDLKLFFNKTIHSGENFSVKIKDGEKSIVYTGDGSPVAGSDFYENLDLLIAETYLYDKEIVGHSSIMSAIKFAENNNVKCLALTHINRDFRKKELPYIKDKIISNKVKIIVPEPLDDYNL